jgi:hypothetical protein
VENEVESIMADEDEDILYINTASGGTIGLILTNVPLKIKSLIREVCSDESRLSQDMNKLRFRLKKIKKEKHELAAEIDSLAKEKNALIYA